MDILLSLKEYCLRPVVNALLKQRDAMKCLLSENRMPLFEAIMLEKWELVREVIAHGVDVTEVDSLGLTPLQRVCSYHDVPLDIVRSLCHPDVINYNKHGTSPLMEAVLNANSELVLLLVQCGANVTAKIESTPSRVTALYRALVTPVLKAMSEEAIVALVHPQTVNVRKQGGVVELGAPLYLAISKGYGDVIDALLHAGADVSVQHAGTLPITKYCTTTWNISPTTLLNISSVNAVLDYQRHLQEVITKWLEQPPKHSANIAQALANILLQTEINKDTMKSMTVQLIYRLQFFCDAKASSNRTFYTQCPRSFV